MTPLGQTTFWDANQFYNAVNLGVGILGTALGVVGLLVAIVQLKKTRTAAEAARDAARSAREKVASVVAIVTVSQLRAWSKELLLMIRLKSFLEAAGKAEDLRSMAAQARQSDGITSLQSQQEWQLLLTLIGDLHESLLAHRIGKEPVEDWTAQCLRTAARINEIISGLSGKSSNRIGDPHANS